ncbi:hypothetical protein GCM10009789_85550 [Kribbella sancticallisti]|uniref:F5/8 type C domain-containing protein n=1 Tax=Kribbella sancticallisti TaxID=460087 RepID=A0ABP4QSG6_9ACTN
MNRAALLAVPLALIVPATATVATGKDPSVTISATPRPVEVVPLPCFPSGRLTLGMTNTGRKPVIADLRISGESPLILSRRQFSSYLPVDQLVTAPLDVTVPRGTAPGTFNVDLTSGRDRLTAPVTVKPAPPKGPGDNLLLGEQAVASSTHGNMKLCGGVDGNSDSAQWGASGWHDATKGVFPDTYGVDLTGPATIGRIELQTLDSARYPAAAMGLRDFDLRIRTAGNWITINETRGNIQGRVSVSFTPVPADAVQVVIHDANDHGYSRLIELEAYTN